MQPPKSNILFVLFLSCMALGIAQNKGDTSNFAKLEGEAYFNKANELAEQSLESSLSHAEKMVQDILAKAEIKDFPSQLARVQYIKGSILTTKGEYRGAQIIFDKALLYFRNAQDKKNMAKTILGKGIALAYMGEASALSALQESKALFKELKDDLGLADALYQQGHYNYLIGDDIRALELYEQSLAIYKTNNHIKGISNNHFRMALAHLGQKNDEKALELLVSARKLKKQINDLMGLAKVNISLGVMHEENGNSETAITYYLESYNANKNTGDQRVNSIIFNNLGVAYSDLRKYDSALVYHKKALDLRKQLINKRGVVQSHMNMGEILQFKKEYELALSNYRIAHKISSSDQSRPLLAGVSNKLGQVFLRLNQLDSASIYLNEALEIRKAKNDYFRMAGTYQNLSQLEEKRGNHKKALEYHKLFKTIQDSSFRVRTTKDLAEVQAKYDTERQQREIGELQQKNKTQKLWRNIWAVGTILALGLILLLFQFFMYRNKKNRALLAAEEAQRQQLQELDTMKSRFFSNISHEFRTPLTLILGPIDQLRKGIDDALHPTLNMMERNGKRLLKLINQLLDLSKIESGKVALKTALVDVVPLVKGLTMSFNSMAENKNIKLLMKTDEASCFLYVDREKIEEVVINLLSNAIKYTPEGGEITVSIKQTNNDFLGISVSDTGTGIPEQELPHIFNRFYQASNADAEDVTGTGIGLALIKELVELHKGSVTVTSKVGKGTTFKLLLPMGRAHLKDDEIVGIRQTQKEKADGIKEILPVALTTKTPIETSDEENPIVLLIEDNEDLRTYIKGILAESYHFMEAINGEEGVKMAKEHIPDIIISDLMMPKMDGLEVCKHLKEELLTSHIPIVLLTAKSSKEDKLEGLKSLADDYLIKPFDTQELLIRLENLIQLRKKIQAKFGMESILSPKKVELTSLDALFMVKVTEQLESEMANSLFGVVELAYAVGLSRSQLFRKVKAITNLTPNEYIRSFRLHRAMDMLKQKGGTVSEVAYATGFQNPSYFSKCFQELFGKAPSSVTK